MLYSLTQINEKAPYRVLEYEENTACFITDTNIVYMVGFIKEDNMNIPNAYQLFITPKGRTKNVGTDIKIGQTVAAIIESFFKTIDNVLVYVCDTSDKLQAARHRKFGTWFRQYATLGKYDFITEKIEIEEYEYFAAMIVDRQHPQYDYTKMQFHQYFQDLRDKLAE